MGEKLPHRIANAGRVADLGKSLDQRGVNRDSARAFMQKLKLKQPLGFADGARVAQKIFLRLGGFWGTRKIVIPARKRRFQSATIPAGRWRFLRGRPWIIVPPPF